VAYLPKARAVEPEKQPLLANGFETTFVSRQRLGKHLLAATDTHTTIEVLLGKVFILGPFKGVIRKKIGGGRVSSVRESVKRELERGNLRISTVEAVTRERLVKTQQAGKCLAGAVVICEL
jgi:hypothetical protein